MTRDDVFQVSINHINNDFFEKPHHLSGWSAPAKGKTTPHIENTTHAWVVEGREESQDSREVKQKEFFNLNHCLYGYSSTLHCANKAEVLKPQD